MDNLAAASARLVVQLEHYLDYGGEEPPQQSLLDQLLLRYPLQHLGVLINFCFFAASDLVEFLFFLGGLAFMLGLVLGSRLLAPLLLELIVNLLYEGKHLDGNMAYYKEHLGVVHVSSSCLFSLLHLYLMGQLLYHAFAILWSVLHLDVEQCVKQGLHGAKPLAVLRAELADQHFNNFDQEARVLLVHHYCLASQLVEHQALVAHKRLLDQHEVRLFLEGEGKAVLEEALLEVEEQLDV